VSELPPRIPRGEAVGRSNVLARMFEIERRLEGVQADLEGNEREYNELFERQHFLVSEHDRLAAQAHTTGSGGERLAESLHDNPGESRAPGRRARRRSSRATDLGRQEGRSDCHRESSPLQGSLGARVGRTRAWGLAQPQPHRAVRGIEDAREIEKEPTWAVLAREVV
jgi:hypothetical protein